MVITYLHVESPKCLMSTDLFDLGRSQEGCCWTHCTAGEAEASVAQRTLWLGRASFCREGNGQPEERGT